MSSHEFPFNERIRTFLRLEDLFKKILLNVEDGQQIAHHNALISLLQMLEIVERADLKVDVLQELDRQRIALNHLRGTPDTAERTLHKTIKEIETCASALRTNTCKIGQHLRDNEWLMSIKQRCTIPGGVCQFDLPSYHYWLSLDSARRTADFASWLVPMMPMYEAIKVILHVLRSRGEPIKHLAQNGFYQQMLSNSKSAQLMKIEVLSHPQCFPEISANKYAINIRFHRLDFVQKPRPCEHDIEFTMTLFNL